MVQNKQLDKGPENSLYMNRKYKDSLFRIAFREKEQLLELYNAINNSSYNNPEELTIYTLEDVIFMGIKNDISFLVGEMLNLYEHQSTENPNMPIRGLMYFARNYESYIARNDLDIYGGTLQKLPFPQYYVLYNGIKDEEDRKVLELKDAFPKQEELEPCLNCRATLLNINYEHNREIMERSRTLKEYSIYVQRIRDNKASGMGMSEAVDKATEDSIREGILKDILVKNSAEVKNLVLGTWGTENHIRKQNEELERLKQETAERKHEIAEQIRKIAERDHKIAERDHKIAERDRKIAERDRKIAERDRKIAERDCKIAERDCKIEEKEQEIEEQKREIVEQVQKNIELKKRKNTENILIQKLLDAGKIEELKRFLADEAYQQKLLEEHQIAT